MPTLTYTLREAREQVRRSRLGILTPLVARIEDALPGDEPDWAQQPSNEVLDDACRDAVRRINLASGSEQNVQTISLAVDAQTADGPYTVNLSDLSVRAGMINNLRDAWWQDASGNYYPLTSRTWAQWGRDGSTPGVMDMDAATPTRYLLQGQTLTLWPAPDTAGTLTLRCGVGLLPPLTDISVFAGLPDDCWADLLDLIAVGAARANIDDTAMQARVATIDAKGALSRICTAIGWQDRRQQGGFVPLTGRRYDAAYTGRTDVSSQYADYETGEA